MARIRVKECKMKENYLKEITLDDIIYNIITTKIKQDNRKVY